MRTWGRRGLPASREALWDPAPPRLDSGLPASSTRSGWSLLFQSQGLQRVVTAARENPYRRRGQKERRAPLPGLTPTTSAHVPLAISSHRVTRGHKGGCRAAVSQFWWRAGPVRLRNQVEPESGESEAHSALQDCHHRLSVPSQLIQVHSCPRLPPRSQMTRPDNLGRATFSEAWCLTGTYKPANQDIWGHWT